ncbi:bacillithiol system redox-active protein YtxJ [Aneurinibacillus sp. Ricciae_BoGa-3]|uniref:bacillithiol system redox-active protein YtxJ n=1 Tax=Aneurinibacillus sp. Ricciae_BoGa-3 TaxID=3022697 RepID=UPI00233FE9C1|nr:bacillithiol system redox-active protein YtxJ [Aneurinibacillus sp. Ricciae_BoGa-3]WCK55761.1 bacillithiol system redox-active protein YtxJ [Aneurinibacillus sp. Ricciae_BoGa-3]
MAEIATVEELDQFLSQNPEAILFKHSTTCPISAQAHNEFMAYTRGDVKPWALVIVQTARPVSNEIAERFAVKHESPQVLYVKDGKVAWHTSHWNITESNLTKEIK